MKIFLTWSGTQSLSVASALRDWIPSVIQRAKPFLSSEDIRKGARWGVEIAQQLSDAEFGVVCLTPENLAAPWIHFEAGAVSKHLEASRVTALLIGVQPGDLTGPLVQFQHTSASKVDVKKLMLEINQLLGPDALSKDSLERSFEAFWPDLDNSLTQATQASVRTPVTVPKKRPPDELLAEVLENSRNIERTLAEILQTQQQLTVRSLTALSLQPNQNPLGTGLLGTPYLAPPSSLYLQQNPISTAFFANTDAGAPTSYLHPNPLGTPLFGSQNPFAGVGEQTQGNETKDRYRKKGG